MKQHGVALTDLDALQLERGLDVLDRDDVLRLEPIDSFIACDVDQYPASEQRTDVLDPEPVATLLDGTSTVLESILLTCCCSSLVLALSKRRTLA